MSRPASEPASPAGGVGEADAAPSTGATSAGAPSTGAAPAAGALWSRVASVRRELAVPLYRNAYALMLNTVVNSLFGLLYWIVAAHTFDDEEVGRSNALISLMMLVSILTQFNFGQALIRFLPRSGTSTRRLLLTAYGLSVGFAVVASGAVTLYCHFVLTPADGMYVSLPFAAWFVVSTTAWSIFALQDSALTGLRSAVWIPLENGLYGVVKLVLLLVVAGTSVQHGVFVSWTVPVIALLVPVNLLIFRRIIPRHAVATAAEQEPPSRQTLTRYMAGDYAGQLFNQLSSTFLPVLVVALFGPAQSAYFLPAQTIFVAMTMLSSAVTSSLVVEGATNEAHVHRYALAVLRRISATVLPASVLIALAAPWVLQLFGAQYRANATLLLQLLMLSTFPRVVVSLYMTKVRLENRTGSIALLQLVQAAALIGGTALLARPLGLVAVGWTALGIEVALALVLAPAVIRWLWPRRGVVS